MQNKIESSDLQNLVSQLEKLLPCNNSVKKEIRREQTKKIQDLLDKNNFPDLNKERLDEINKGLAGKNYLLIRDLKNELILKGKDNVFEETYAERYQYFLTNSNDKAQCEQALLAIVKDLSGLLIKEKEEINFLDIGAGDGCMALPLVKDLAQSSQVNYIAVERDGQFAPGIQQKFDAEKLPCTVYSQDFRKILEQLGQGNPAFALVSHLYTTTPMPEFFPMIVNILKENGIIVLVHDTSKSDAVDFRAKFGSALSQVNRDYTKEIKQAINQLHYHSITDTYDSWLTFPNLSPNDWQSLKTIKQADYTNSYDHFSPSLKAAKNLIEFVISDRLESLSDVEREAILTQFEKTLSANNNRFKSSCKIQVVLSPKHTLECERQFLQLKEKIEKPRVSNLSLLAAKPSDKKEESCLSDFLSIKPN